MRLKAVVAIAAGLLVCVIAQSDVGAAVDHGVTGWPTQGAHPGSNTLVTDLSGQDTFRPPVNHGFRTALLPTEAGLQPTVASTSGLTHEGIPHVALNAYRVAAIRVDRAYPGCGIDWALLAGIGRAESDHGRFGGAVLNADGTSTPRTIGPALDGASAAYIAAPPNGQELDGDARFAHALGPMQFIPTTWAAFGVDANGDGHADVFNINDAALGAARYLCSTGGDLRTVTGQKAAVLSYNANDRYLAQVLAVADAYRRGMAPTGIPIGDVSGALPPLSRTSSGPPVNPGPPTAASRTNKPVSGVNGSTARKATATSSPVASPGAGDVRAPGGGSDGVASRSQTPTPTPTPTTTAPGEVPKICILWDLFVSGQCDLWFQPL